MTEGGGCLDAGVYFRMTLFHDQVLKTTSDAAEGERTNQQLRAWIGAGNRLYSNEQNGRTSCFFSLFDNNRIASLPLRLVSSLKAAQSKSG